MRLNIDESSLSKAFVKGKKSIPQNKLFKLSQLGKSNAESHSMSQVTNKSVNKESSIVERRESLVASAGLKQKLTLKVAEELAASGKSLPRVSRSHKLIRSLDTSLQSIGDLSSVNKSIEFKGIRRRAPYAYLKLQNTKDDFVSSISIHEKRQPVVVARPNLSNFRSIGSSANSLKWVALSEKQMESKKEFPLSSKFGFENTRLENEFVSWKINQETRRSSKFTYNPIGM